MNSCTWTLVTVAISPAPDGGFHRESMSSQAKPTHIPHSMLREIKVQIARRHEGGTGTPIPHTSPWVHSQVKTSRQITTYIANMKCPIWRHTSALVLVGMTTALAHCDAPSGATTEVAKVAHTLSWSSVDVVYILLVQILEVLLQLTRFACIVHNIYCRHSSRPLVSLMGLSWSYHAGDIVCYWVSQRGNRSKFAACPLFSASGGPSTVNTSTIFVPQGAIWFGI